MQILIFNLTPFSIPYSNVNLLLKHHLVYTNSNKHTIFAS
nr:MAG TPA: hypothetical protein [Caudoviricetes sp.]